MPLDGHAELFVGLQIHEVKQLTVGIEELYFLGFDVDILQVLLALVDLFQHLAGDQTLQLQPHEGRALSRIDELPLHNHMGFILDEQKYTF